MMKNPVQFQKGLGLLEFLGQYSDEERCRDALFRLRWPSGFVCPECGGHRHCELISRRFGNVKSAIRGAFHAVSEKHAHRYLAEFKYRFNRRFHLPDMIERLLYVSLRTPPMPYRLLTFAEPIR